MPDEVDEGRARRDRRNVERRKGDRVRVEEGETLVHDDETDRNLLEDGAREEAGLLAAFTFGRDEAREAREGDEDFLRLLGASGRRLGMAAGRGLGDARADALEVARVALPDERHDDRRR